MRIENLEDLEHVPSGEPGSSLQDHHKFGLRDIDACILMRRRIGSRDGNA